MIHLPPRQLRVKPPGRTVASDARLVVFNALLFLGATLLVLFPIPALVTDLAVRDTARPLPGARIEKGSCQTTLFLVSCDADLVMRSAGRAPLRRTLHYFFVDAHLGDYTARVVADPSRPEDMTTDLALEKMTNRLVTLSIGAPLCLAVVLAVAWWSSRTLRRHRAVRRALSGRLQRLVVMQMVGIGARAVVTSYMRPDGNVVTERWKLPKKSRPFVLDERQRTLLGITAGDGTVAMPLDRELRWIGLTKEERAAAIVSWHVRRAV